MSPICVHVFTALDSCLNGHELAYDLLLRVRCALVVCLFEFPFQYVV